MFKGMFDLCLEGTVKPGGDRELQIQLAPVLNLTSHPTKLSVEVRVMSTNLERSAAKAFLLGP